MKGFDAVLDEYEAGRPGYPEAVYDALEPLGGLRVVEGGAGTGIATRALLRRGATVLAFDVSERALRRATARSPALRAIVADGGALPLRDGCADVLCFAQSWHWLDEARRVREAARTIRPGGRWAAWWSHARADGQGWFDGYWAAIESSTGVNRDERDVDRSDDIRRSASFETPRKRTIAWDRSVSIATWLVEERSKTYVATLPDDHRVQLLLSIEDILQRAFPSGRMVVPYETWLWVATRSADGS